MRVWKGRWKTMEQSVQYLPLPAHELEREAVVEGGVHYTYAALFRLCDEFKAELDQKRLPAQAVICIHSETTVHLIAALLVFLRSSHILVPISPAEEVGRAAQKWASHKCVISRSGVYTWSSVKPEAAPGHALFDVLKQRQAPGLILSSSGSTGHPKVMLHDLRALMGRFEGRAMNDTRCLLLMSLDHIGGLDVAFRNLFSGACLVIPDNRSPAEVGRLIEAEKVSVLPATPTFLGLCLMEGVFGRVDCASLKTVAYGAEPMPETLLQRLHVALPAARFVETYGTSETSAVRTVAAPGLGKFIRIKDKGTAWKLVDGELWLRTPSRILGYLEGGSDRSLGESGWFATGDLAETDGKGGVRIVGRVGHIINIGGEKVNPQEVENALRRLKGIEDARVHGEPHPMMGQQLVATLVVAEPVAELGNAIRTEMRRHLRREFPVWKIPSRVIVQTEPFAMNQRLKRGP